MTIVAFGDGMSNMSAIVNNFHLSENSKMHNEIGISYFFHACKSVKHFDK